MHKMNHAWSGLPGLCHLCGYFDGNGLVYPVRYFRTLALFVFTFVWFDYGLKLFVANSYLAFFYYLCCDRFIMEVCYIGHG